MGLLHDAGLADFYLQDIHGLNGLLVDMSARGMPVDHAKRLEAAQALEVERAQALAELRALIPPECCPKKTYKREPDTQKPVATTQQTVMVKVCDDCSAQRPNKKHTCWKDKEPAWTLKEHSVTVWVVTQPFVLSPKGLLTYIKHCGYSTPKKFDRNTGERRTTTDEAALLRLALSHEDDQVFALVLKHRDLDRQLSSYIGRPA